MKRKIICLLGIVCAVYTAWAEPMTFTVSPGESNSIRFESKAPLETIVGTTDQVSGGITLDPANLEAGISASIVVDAASLKTGNRIRDGHMRNNHLHTAQYPEIIFALDNFMLEGTTQEGATLKYTVDGEFSLHGTTRKISVPAEVTYTKEASGSKLHVVANFQVKLSDYNIPRPQFLIMKLDEVQRITVDIRGVTP